MKYFSMIFVASWAISQCLSAMDMNRIECADTNQVTRTIYIREDGFTLEHNDLQTGDSLKLSEKSTDDAFIFSIDKPKQKKAISCNSNEINWHFTRFKKPRRVLLSVRSIFYCAYN